MLAHRSLRLAAATASLLLGACSEEMAVHPGLVTPAEVHAFYVSHPALFEGRRLYSLREIVVSTPAAGIVGLEDRVARSHSLRDVESWLAQRGANFQTTRVTHAVCPSICPCKSPVAAFQSRTTLSRPPLTISVPSLLMATASSGFVLI